MMEAKRPPGAVLARPEAEGVGAQLNAPQRMLLSVEVEDVDQLLPRVTQLGGRVRGLPNDMPWGQRVAHAQDPDGNSVNLVQPI